MTTMLNKHFISPDWPAPKNIHACATTRRNPVGIENGETFNLATHGSGNVGQVEQNRAILARELNLPSAPSWLQQVHGRDVIKLNQPLTKPVLADGSFTSHSGVVCAVLTADCLPVLLCDQSGSIVAAVHAGWRGLQQNILSAAIQSMAVDPKIILAWFGPAISSNVYEVDEKVRNQFTEEKYKSVFIATRSGHWNMSLTAIAQIQLQELGVTRIYNSGYCTYSQNNLFFSHRKEANTGRMASLIWRE